MEVVFNITMCMVGVIIGHVIVYLFTRNKKERTGKDMCTTCDHCKVITTHGERATDMICPLWRSTYYYPATCACYKPRKEENKN